ncbi:unnamed protein product, partial [Vitis vinifera]|uniref:Uncharacterized protein n=1 Tax=Vitis vinifera TaxID=29760 RepID=D7TDN5_VITVI
MSNHVLEENFLQALSEAYNKPRKSSCHIKIFESLICRCVSEALGV